MSENRKNEDPEKEDKTQELSEFELLKASLAEIEGKIEKLNEETKAKFITVPLNKDSIPEPAKRKENDTLNQEIKFNGLEVFAPQFADPSKMLTWRQNCDILTMRLSADPRYPEWQVS